MKPSLITDRNEKNDAIKTLNENKKSITKKGRALRSKNKKDNVHEQVYEMASIQMT